MWKVVSPDEHRIEAFNLTSQDGSLTKLILLDLTLVNRPCKERSIGEVRLKNFESKSTKFIKTSAPSLEETPYFLSVKNPFGVQNLDDFFGKHLAFLE